MKYPIRMSLLLPGLFTLAGCSLFGDDGFIEAEDVNGYWEAVSGNLQFSGSPGAIYYYNWYILEASASSQEVSVTWDNGRTCITSIGKRRGQQIHLTVDGVKANFKIYSAKTASVTFESGETTYSKKLVKKRESTDFTCM